MWCFVSCCFWREKREEIPGWIEFSGFVCGGGTVCQHSAVVPRPGIVSWCNVSCRRRLFVDALHVILSAVLLQPSAWARRCQIYSFEFAIIRREIISRKCLCQWMWVLLDCVPFERRKLKCGRNRMSRISLSSFLSSMLSVLKEKDGVWDSDALCMSSSM